MQIVLDIDENVFTRLLDNGIEDCEIANDDLSAIAKSIRKGTPLPKGHGRLIDARIFANEVNALKDNWNRYRNEYECGRYESYDYTIDMIEDAPTIIEADNAESEEV